MAALQWIPPIDSNRNLNGRAKRLPPTRFKRSIEPSPLRKHIDTVQIDTLVRPSTNVLNSLFNCYCFHCN